MKFASLALAFSLAGSALADNFSKTDLNALLETTKNLNIYNKWSGDKCCTCILPVGPCLSHWQGVTCYSSRITKLSLFAVGKGNKLTADIAKLTGLTHLNLEGTELAEIPHEIGALQSLEELIISSRESTQPFPAEINTLSRLRSLKVIFYGTSPQALPFDFSRLTRLQKLSVAGNFNGGIPSNIALLQDLEEIDLSYSGLGGAIPSVFFTLPRLRSITFVGTKFSGPIPSSIGTLRNLVTFEATGNPFTGTLPESIGSLRNLRNLGLSGCGFNGTIPASFGALSRLSKLYLAFNSLTGTIPVSISKLTRLRRLVLSNNGLTGTIPREIVQLKSLDTLYLENNKITGILPLFYDMKALTTIFLSGNPLTCPVANYGRNSTETSDRAKYPAVGVALPTCNDSEACVAESTRYVCRKPTF